MTTLTAGTRLGPYEIVSPLGSGGMGEVYLARDTRLGRDVAIKVLRQQLAGSAELRARFEREARAISSLNHPHICTLFDVGRAPGEAGAADVEYLVMERVEGETLAQRLGRGPLPPAELLKLGAQIADALDRAHRAGIVHRDLKPGNVMLTRSGAKLMDFGLARAGEGPGGPVTPASLTRSPTVAQPLTAEGSLVGTFQYMSPEQLEGREADARSDVWSFGCVLYEMATGRRAFDGRSQASLISAIMTSDPPAIAPSGRDGNAGAIDRVVRQCLAKDPDERWQSAGDLKRELEWIRAQGSSSGMPRPDAPPVARRGASRALLLWAALATVATAVLLWNLQGGSRGPAGAAYLSVPTPQSLTLSSEPGDLAISPDGEHVAFVSVDSTNRGHLWIRDLDNPAPRPVAESETACRPFWSPDGRWLAFFTGRERTDGKHAQLLKVRVEGGAPIALCDVEWSRGGTWGKNGDILFVPGPQTPVSRVSANGGAVTPVTQLDPSRKETSHRFPSFLPDGDHFVYAALPGADGGVTIRLGSLRGKTARVIGSSSSGATFVAPHFLVYELERNLVARRIDLARLELVGDPLPIAPGPPPTAEEATRVATASAQGRLVTLEQEQPLAHLEWFDRSGRALGRSPAPSADYFACRVSPDGRRAGLARAITRLTNQLDIVDLQRGTVSRFDAPGSNQPGPWSPDGREMAIMSSRNGHEEIYRMPTDGGGEPRLVPTVAGQYKNPGAWSPDGSTLVFFAMRPGSGFDLLAADLAHGGTPRVIDGSRGDQMWSDISPDGKWIAYASSETGRDEIYCCALADGRGKVQVTTTGGSFPHWSGDGKEIYFVPPDFLTIQVVSIGHGAQGAIEPGGARTLFRLPSAQISSDSWSYSRALDRFLMLRTDAEQPPPRISLLANWTARLGKP